MVFLLFKTTNFLIPSEKAKVLQVSLHFLTLSKKKAMSAKYSIHNLHNKDSNRYCIQVAVQNFMFKDKRLNDLILRTDLIYY